MNVLVDSNIIIYASKPSYSGSHSDGPRRRKKGTGSRPSIKPTDPGKSLAGRVPVPFFRVQREREPL